MFEVPRVEMQRSSFNLSHGHKMSFNEGYIVPFYADEVLPGDSFKVNVNMLCRLTTPIVPIMDNLYFDVFFFFVPNRLIWTNWNKFMGEQENPGDSTDYLIPQVVINLGSTPLPPAAGNTMPFFFEYLGVPIWNATPTSIFTVNALHSRAYNLIYNEWFRDENLIDSAVVDKDDGPDDALDYYLRRRGKRHDYFTSCLPWPQKDAGVNIPIGGMQVVPDGAGVAPWFTAPNGGTYSLRTGASSPALDVSVGGGTFQANTNLTWLDPNLRVDVTGGTINQLRQAFQIQRLLERDARGGTRYTELVRAHFNVISPDARLQRPEYLGGGEIAMIVHPVAQTSGSAPGVPPSGYSDTPQGNLAAIGVASGHAGGFSKSFTEHGVILGLLSARADLTYQQGLHKMFSRRTKYDFYWPAFSHLGEQAVLRKEIYCLGDVDVSQNDTVFGYQERWAEYRQRGSRISGVLNSNHPQPIDFWHLAEDFGSFPVLGQTFIENNPPVSRITAVPTVDANFIMDCWLDIKAARPMPVYSVPGLVDHF